MYALLAVMDLHDVSRYLLPAAGRSVADFVWNRDLLPVPRLPARCLLVERVLCAGPHVLQQLTGVGRELASIDNEALVTLKVFLLLAPVHGEGDGT